MVTKKTYPYIFYYFYKNAIKFAHLDVCLCLIVPSDVARPLSYKTKTGQAKTKTAFFKDHQIINPRLLA